jgi:hypothetical protein
VCHISYHKCGSKAVAARLMLNRPVIPELARAQYSEGLCFLDAQAKYDACGEGSVVEAIYTDHAANRRSVRVFEAGSGAVAL